MKTLTVKAIEADPTYRHGFWADEFRYDGQYRPTPPAGRYKQIAMQIAELASQGCRFNMAGEVITVEIGTFKATYNTAGWPMVCREFVKSRLLN